MDFLSFDLDNYDLKQLREFEQDLIYVLEQWNLPYEYSYRKSGSGNGYHVMVGEISELGLSFDDAIKIRTVLFDDPLRIQADIIRNKQGLDTGILFDEYQKDGKTFSAGRYTYVC